MSFGVPQCLARQRVRSLKPPYALGQNPGLLCGSNSDQSRCFGTRRPMTTQARFFMISYDFIYFWFHMISNDFIRFAWFSFDFLARDIWFRLDQCSGVKTPRQFRTWLQTWSQLPSQKRWVDSGGRMKWNGNLWEHVCPKPAFMGDCLSYTRAQGCWPLMKLQQSGVRRRQDNARQYVARWGAV